MPMTYSKTLTIMLIAAALAGCATNSGVISNGQGRYSVSRQAATGFAGLGNLKGEVQTEARQHCRALGADLFITNATQSEPPYVMGNFPRVELEFRCASPTATADAAISECKQRRLNRELKTLRASVDCSNPRIYAAWRDAGDPHLDLLGVVLAARAAGADKVDKGQITEAEYELQLAQLNARLNDERGRRNLATMEQQARQTEATAHVRAAEAQSAAALLQGLAAFRSPSRVIYVCNIKPGEVDTCSYRQ